MLKVLLFVSVHERRVGLSIEVSCIVESRRIVERDCDCRRFILVGAENFDPLDNLVGNLVLLAR
jgi:hypothetical protein